MRSFPRAIIGLVLLALVAGVGMEFWDARASAIQSACIGRMVHQATAFGLDYHGAHAFPPEIRATSDGSIQPWTRNFGEAPSIPDTWKCPSGKSQYCAVIGPGTIFGGAHPTTADEVTDGVANTILLVELSLRECPPSEGERPAVRIDDFAALVGPGGRLAAKSIHDAGRGILFADCQIYRLVKPLDLATLKALATKSGGEPVTREQLIKDGYFGDPAWRAMIPENGPFPFEEELKRAEGSGKP